MKTFSKLTFLSALLFTGVVVEKTSQAATVIVSDNYTVTTSGTGFALNAGVNTGINPPTTRLTGSAVANLRYYQTVTTKPASQYDINNNRLRVAQDPTTAVTGRFILSSNGTTPFDFAPALGTAVAAPGNPVVYDVKIGMRNDATTTSRFTLGVATVEGDVNNLDFGVQMYRAASGNNFYTIQKRIDQGSFNGTTTTDGTGDINAVMVATGAGTNNISVDFLIRVTDAGSESGANYNSRIQVSVNNGSTWIYDTATDASLFNRFRFDGAGRYFVFDVAGNTSGPVYYDSFSVTWNSGPRAWTGAGANGNWNNATNWGGAVPASGDKLIFNGTTRQTNTNDLSALSVPWVKLNNGGFSLYGNAFTVTNAITNVTGSSTLNNAITAGGTLRFQSDAGTITLAGNITGGAQNLIADGAGNTTASGAISGTGSLTKGGAGTLTLSGTSANTLSGNSIVNTGIISLAKTAGVNALAGNMTIGDGVGGTGVDIVRLAAANQISDTAAITVSASGSLDLNGFAETVASVSGASSTSQIALGAGTLTVGNGSAITFAGSISGTGNIVKQGASTLTLSGASSFSGTATINAGALNVQNATALGGAGATVVSSGTALEVQGGIAISGEPLTLNGSGISSAGVLRNISGNNSWSGAVTLGSASRIHSDSGTLTISGGVGGGQNLTVAGAGNTTISGIISSGSVTKESSGILTLGGANTYSGNTTISAGTLALGSGGSISSSPAITIVNGATLDVSATSFSVGASQTLVRNATSGSGSVNGALTLSSGAIVSVQANGTGATVGSLSVTGNLTLNGNTIAINVTGSALGASTNALITYTGSKSGSFAAPTITGSGLAAGMAAEIIESAGQISLRVYYDPKRTWSGAGANDNWSAGANWAGTAPVNGDELIFNGTTRQINTNDISGLSVPLITFNNGGFALYGNALTVTSAITNLTGNNALNGPVTLGGAVRFQSDSGTLTMGGGITGGSQNLTVGGAGDTIVSGVISGTGSLTKNNSGLLQLSGASANTYSGSTIVNAGTVSLAKTSGDAISGNVTVGDGTASDTLQLSAANQISDSSVVTIDSTGILDLNSFIETVASISSASSASQISLGNATLTVGDANSATFAGIISGSGSLVKQGSGTLTLSGANTFSGNTTINTGTLALGTGGSISSSPNITIANGTTLNVSAISFSLGASQTLVRNATSGSGSVNGSMTLASGAKISLQANGSGTVGTLSVTGGLTLNANVITLNIASSPLGLGTYPLITYTGSKSGSFNTNATITGSGIAAGKSSRIIESAGQISLEVYTPGIPAHGVAAASIKVVENDLANTTNSVVVTTTVSINGLQVRDGSSRGDYTVQVGTSGTDDVAGGALITCVAENGKDHGEDSGINYCSSAISLNSGGYFIPTTTASGGGEYNINVAAAYFAYNKYLGGYARNSGGTNGGANNLLTSSSGINLGTQFVDNGGGVSTVNLTGLGINSQTDGVLLVTAAANDNHYASSIANTNGTWTIYAKDNTTDGAVYEQAPVAFAFVPKTNISVISGKFMGDGTITMFSGSSAAFSVTEVTNGTWQLTIPGFSPSKGVLVISAEGGNGANADNIVSYQASGSNWIIHSRDLPGQGLQALTTQAVVSFVFIPAPSITLVSPANNANVSSTPTLTVSATNHIPGNLTVTFSGHRLPKPGPGEDFLMAVLPDTQNYARENAGSGDAVKEMWFAQTDWIVNNRVSENIAYVATLGDCVQNGEDTSEWRNATNAYYRLEKQSLTDLLDGIPYGVTVGNHDQQPNGDPDGTTILYNQYFGSAHFANKDYYEGHYSSNNDSWATLFSGGGLDFLVLSFEYGRYGDAVLDWADSVMAAHPTRRVIALTHHAGDDQADVNATTTTFSTQGSAIYDRLKNNTNFFLMLGGHVFNEGGEGRRSDTFNGKTVRTIISDYQGRFNGGNGLMRLMYFSPSNNLISIKTYSPWTDNYETDANSQFTYTYNMQPNGAGVAGTSYASIKTNVNVVPGAQTSFAWSGLTASRTYEWYVTVTDVNGDYATSVEWTFNTTSGFARPAPGDANSNGIPDDWENSYGISDASADADGDGQSNYAEYMANTNPTNAASALRILEATQSAGNIVLKWSSVGGTRYRIQYANELNGGFSDLVREESTERDAQPNGQPSTQTFTDISGSTNAVRYFRIKVVP